MSKKKRARRSRDDWRIPPDRAPRLWLVWAYRYVPRYRLFDLGDEVLGVIEQEPLEYVWEGRPPYECDGSVYMTAKQARKMVERSDYANYLHYSLLSEESSCVD